LKVSKLGVIFEEIRRTGGCGRRRGPAAAESAFPLYRSGGSCRGRRARAARNRRSNGDRVRIGFKISKIINTRFKRDSFVRFPCTALPRDRAPDGGAPRVPCRPAAPTRPRRPATRVRPSARTVYRTPPLSLVMSSLLVLMVHGRYQLSRIFRRRRFDAP